MTDKSASTGAMVAAASTTAAASLSNLGGVHLHGDQDDSDNFSATAALVSYLRMEADMADDKARRLRAQAAAMSIQFGVTDETQDAYELNPDDLPPLDEHGIPKYKGKKRGRKPKAKKRKMNPDRPKRKHTGYTFYMQETYPGIKAANPSLASKEVISIVAKQWKDDLATEEKQSWKERARTAHESTLGDVPDADNNEDAEEDGADGEDHDDDEDETVGAGSGPPNNDEDAYDNDDDNDEEGGRETEDAAVDREGDGNDVDSAAPARRRNRRVRK